MCNSVVCCKKCKKESQERKKRAIILKEKQANTLNEKHPSLHANSN